MSEPRSDPQPLRILIAEDNLLTRLGTLTLLETQPDFTIVATAADGEEGLRLFEEHKPDMAIVDLRMPKLDGVGLTRALCGKQPPARVLVLTHYQGEEDIFQALRAGALGYISKESPGEHLMAAIRAVAAGKRYLPPELAERLREREARPTLTAREREVLLLVFKGLTNRQLADVLGISPKTAAVHVASLLEKFGAQSRTEAVAIGLDRGLLSQD